MKIHFVLFSLLMIFLAGCVDTDSSARYPSSDTNDTNGGSDNNDSDGGTGDDDLDSYDPSEDQERSDFDTRNAVLDPKACTTTGFNARENSSLDPESVVDEENGIAIYSLLPRDDKDEKTRVTLYYPDLIATAVPKQIKIEEQQRYIITFSESWPANTDHTIYVRTPRDIDSRYYGCVRYKLAANSADIVRTRVYRLK